MQCVLSPSLLSARLRWASARAAAAALDSGCEDTGGIRTDSETVEGITNMSSLHATNNIGGVLSLTASAADNVVFVFAMASAWGSSRNWAICTEQGVYQ